MMHSCDEEASRHPLAETRGAGEKKLRGDRIDSN